MRIGDGSDLDKFQMLLMSLSGSWFSFRWIPRVNATGFLVLTERSGHLHRFTHPRPEASVEPSAEMGGTLKGCGGQDKAGSSLPFCLHSAASTVTRHSRSPLGKVPFFQSQGEMEMM